MKSPQLHLFVFHGRILNSSVPSQRLSILPERLSVCRLPPDAPIPAWATTGSFWSITRTRDELSIVCLDEAAPPDVRAERVWRAFAVAGPIDFALTGVLSSIAEPLAAAGISVFAVATFDTDYVLVKAEALEAAVGALRDAGHAVAL